MDKGIVVLSLFDGISVGMHAAKKLGLNIKKYYASEIDAQAIKCSEYNFSEKIIRIGDVTKVRYENGILFTEKGEFEVGKIDLLIGGSPCQDFSIANKERKGLEGQKSKLFYEYLRIKKEVNAKYFLLENVRMKKECKKELDDYLEVEGVAIDSNLLTFQNRFRFYWTNSIIEKIEDKKVDFQDYIGVGNLEEAATNKTPSRVRMWNDGKGRETSSNCDNITNSHKIGCLTTKQDRCPNSGLIQYKDFCRYLTRQEMELAQGLPIGTTDCLSYNKAQKVLGNCWTVDVIAHIFKDMKF